MEQLYLTKKKEFIDKQAAKVENKSTKESWESPEKPLEKSSQEKPQEKPSQEEPLEKPSQEKLLEKPDQEKPLEKPSQEKPLEKPSQEKANYAVADQKQTEKAPAVAA